MIDILIVDDDPNIVDVLQMVLECNAYTVASARHGIAAIEWLEGAIPLPRLIITDISMPEMDGPTLIAHIAQIPRLRDIPVFVMTAEARPQVLLQGLSIAGLFRKPFALDTLLAQIDAVIQQPAAA